MSLRVKLLPTSQGSDSQLQPLTSFLVNDCVAIDAGSLGLSLTHEEQVRVTDVIITHPHIDHTGGLPIHVAAAYAALREPVRVYGTREVIEPLRQHLFNEVLWPDFTCINLVDSERPSMEFHVIEEFAPFQVAGLRVTAVPVNHVVPTVGLSVEAENASVVFTSDTYKTDAIWELANRLDDLKAVFVDCSFPNEFAWLAEASKHLTPELIVEEMRKLASPVHVYAVHIKPSARDQVVAEVEQLRRDDFTVARIGYEYSW
jgi:cAMP phosphodiesterase